MSIVTRVTAIVTVATVALVCAWPQVRADTSTPRPTDGWVSSTPEEQGMDSGLLAQGIEYLGREDRLDVHSATVIRNGTVVADAYFAPFAEGGQHNLASVTKSSLATIVGEGE